MPHRIHPAHTMPFPQLLERLTAARDNRLVTERRGPDGLQLYVYTERCVYEGAWDDITMAARGLILDASAGRIVATPFPKFFNAGERGQPIPDLPFQALEKLDGSLIIIFHHGGRWRAATKGAFDSWQAQWAHEFMQAADLTLLQPGTTYLAEGVHPQNRIVVTYAEPALVLLGGYDRTGTEISFGDLQALSTAIGWRTAERVDLGSLAELMAHTKGLPRSQEGFVVRFENGLRLKLKGDEYKRIHALISRITPLAMWEAMAANDDMETIRREIPEEFLVDFDAIVGLLRGTLEKRLARVADVCAGLAHLSDKEVGLQLTQIDAQARPFVFAYRKGGGDLMQGRNREAVFRSFRPTGNVLTGYVPSYAMARVMDEGE
jgi:RNA ligase